MTAAATGVRARLLAWASLTTLAAALWYRPSIAAVAEVIARPMSVVDQHLVHGWGVLALCLGGLWLKRAAIHEGLGRSIGRWSFACGVAWLGASLVLFSPAALLAGAVGLFALLLGRAALWPSMLTGIYVVSIAFPVAVERWADAQVGAVTAASAGAVLRAVGYPLVLTGQFIALPDSAGHVIRVLINSSCAGPATLGVFLAIFALMSIDAPLPWRSSAALFAFGFVGTWLQNVGRLVYLLLLGHHEGEAAMWAAHGDSGYLWFIGWYAAFGLVYLRFAAGRRGGASLGPGAAPRPGLRAALAGV